jgi:hypothetical protein
MTLPTLCTPTTSRVVSGDVMVERPFVRLFKPFDELVAECKVLL